MSDSDSDSGYTPKRGYPLHEAAEQGDLELLRRIVSIKEQSEKEEEEEADHAGENDVHAHGGLNGAEDMDVCGTSGGAKQKAGDDEDDGEDDDESFHGGGGEGGGGDEDDDDDDDDDDDEEGGDDQGFLMPIPLDLNEKDNFNCTALHVAIHARYVCLIDMAPYSGG